jgi:hypothetical protein
MNFQVSIDGGLQTQYQIDGMCDGCNATYNFTAYNVQSLQNGSHTLDLTLLNATGENRIPVGPGRTMFYFDFAAVDALPIQAIQLQLLLHHQPLLLLSRSQIRLDHLTLNNI